VQLLHGPLLGCVTDNSARFWVRTLDEVPVQAGCGHRPDHANPIRSDVRTTRAGDDYTAIVEVRGLQPATTYHYDVLVGAKPTWGPDKPSFRTYPPAGARVRFQVAFGGGAGYNYQTERMWDLIRGYAPAAMLFMGDNVYIDLPKCPTACTTTPTIAGNRDRSSGALSPLRRHTPSGTTTTRDG